MIKGNDLASWIVTHLKNDEEVSFRKESDYPRLTIMLRDTSRRSPIMFQQSISLTDLHHHRMPADVLLIEFILNMQLKIIEYKMRHPESEEFKRENTGKIKEVEAVEDEIERARRLT